MPKFKIHKVDKSKYVILDNNNMMVSSSYILSYKEAKQDLKDLLEYFS